MKLPRFVPLAVLAALSACGSSPPPPSLSITCNGSLALSGAQSVDVAPDPATRATVLTFPDPVNAGRSGTIPVPAGQKCTIGMTVSK